MHEMVLGELATGTFKNRRLLLRRWKALPMVSSATTDEVLELIETHQLMGRGIGWIDLHLLSAAAQDNSQLWTRDKRLKAVAGSLGLNIAIA